MDTSPSALARDDDAGDEPASGLTRAIRAGIGLHVLESGLATARFAPVLAAPPENHIEPAGASPVAAADDADPNSMAAAAIAEPRRPWIRRAARRGLRLFRPLVLPFLHRLEWRIRTAIEKTEFARDATRRLEELRADTKTLRSDTGALRAETETLRADTGVLRADTETLRADTGALRAETETLRSDTGALRSHTEALQSALQREMEVTQRSLSELAGIVRTLAAQAADRADHANRQLDSLRREVADGVAAPLHQLLRRSVVPLNDGAVLVRTPSGWLVAPGEDERLLMALVETGGLLEPGTVEILTALLRPGDTMIDVGAHIGTITLAAARAVGPRGHVVAVEPAPRTAALLRRSLHINSIADQVTLHVCAAGREEGEAHLHLAPVLGENSLIPLAGDDGGGASVLVALHSLDTLVPPGGRSGRIAVVKIDAEGYELEVWAGMERIIAENPELAVIVEFGPSHLARTGIAISAWFDTLQAPGFTAWEIDEAAERIRPLRAPPERADVLSLNVLLLRLPPSHYPRLRVA